jgi:hypothetical protein
MNTTGINRPRWRRFRIFYYGFLALCGLLLLAFIPVMDGHHKRQSANEASAVAKLRTEIALETQYAAAHPEKGYTCDLPLLRPAGQQQGENYDDPFAFLVTATRSGYKFVLGNCFPDAKGVVTHYQAAAVPVERGVTGFRALCADDSGVIWYDAEGSSTECLASRRLLE